MNEQLKPYKTVEEIAKKHRLEVSFIQKQLDMGAPIEHEHTKNQKLATEIALQHLDEIPDYYTRLKKMESSAKKSHKKYKDVTEGKKMKGEDPCWKGYQMVGKKKKNGKEVPNCVPVKEENGMMRYCPKCEKDETRDVCKYGPKYWDMFSLPSRLSPNQMKFSIAQVHPANESKEPDHEYSMARSELSTIISAAKRLRGKLKGEGNIEAWVQSKITKAADYIDTAADYLESGEHNVEEACWVGYKKVGMKKKGKKIVPNCVAESVSIEDANGNPYVEFIDIIKPEPLKSSIKEQKTFSTFISEAKKSEMKCNSPKSDPVGDSLTGKSHVVKACEGGKEKLLRFGQRGVKGSPKKEGESKEYASRRKRFQTRHAKNIAKGKMSAAYWANKVKW
jgi:hypothetical protein